MRCLVCGEPTRLAVTTPTSNGCTANVRQCAANEYHRFDTVEVPAAVTAEIGVSAVTKSVATAMRGAVQRANSSRFRRVVRELMGHKPAPEIARFLGISSARVRQLIREIKLTEPVAECAANPRDGYRSIVHRIGDDDA